MRDALPLCDCARVARDAVLDPADPVQLDRIVTIYLRLKNPRSRARGALFVRRSGWHRWNECALTGIEGPRWSSGRPTRASRAWARWIRAMLGAYIMAQMLLLAPPATTPTQQAHARRSTGQEMRP